MFEDDDIIFSYSRKEAIEDGVLVDVSYLARQEGFVYPVAVTRSVFNRYVTPDGSARDDGETVMGRLHDMLTVLRFSVKRAEHKDPSVVFFDVKFTVHGRSRVVRLKSMCGPGDDMEPVITVMLPDED